MQDHNGISTLPDRTMIIGIPVPARPHRLPRLLMRTGRTWGKLSRQMAAPSSGAHRKRALAHPEAFVILSPQRCDVFRRCRPLQFHSFW